MDADTESESRPVDDEARWSVARLIFWVAVAVSLVAVALLDLQLARADSAGPPHQDIEIAGRIPATIYMPPDSPASSRGTVQPPRYRGPALILAHGVTADRVGMSSLARRIADSGYVVVTYDAPGHGQNNESFTSGPDGQVDDMKAVYDWLEQSPFADPKRIAVAGHSMGAGTALEFATRDPRPAAVISLSGGWLGTGPERPKNVLFVVAQRDPQPIWDASKESVTKLTGADPVEFDRTYGEIGRQDAVSITEIKGTDHITVLFAPETVSKSVGWLQQNFKGIDVTQLGQIGDARIPMTLFYLPFMLVLLAALGVLSGRLAPQRAPKPRDGVWPGVVIAALALVLVAPFVVAGASGASIPASIVGPVIVYLAAAGAILLTLQLTRRRNLVTSIPVSWLGGESDDFGPLRSLIVPVLISVAGFYLLVAPLGVLFHNFALSPKRMAVSALAAVLFFPAYLGFSTIVRRGPTWLATTASIVVRLVVLIVLAIGALMGLFPFVVVLLVPALAIVFVMLEFYSTAAYMNGRNTLLIAVVESLFLGYLLAATMPITI